MILASCGCHDKYHKLGGLRQHNVFFPIVLEDRSLKSSCHWQESWVQSLVQEDPLEKGMASYFSTPTWRIPWNPVHEVAKSWTQLSE